MSPPPPAGGGGPRDRARPAPASPTLPRPTSAPASLRERLRRDTRAAHDRVDAAFARFDLHTRQGYAGFLRAHAAALPALEQALEAGGVAERLADWPDRRRTPALRRDLAALQVGAPPPLPPPAYGDPARLLGGLYVLEGSRLGARLLLRQVLAGPDPSVCGATAYLAHGAGRRFWPDVLALLAAHRGEPRPVIEAALATFAVFEAAATAS